MRPARPALASDVYGLVSMRSAVGQHVRAGVTSDVAGLVIMHACRSGRRRGGLRCGGRRMVQAPPAWAAPRVGGGHWLVPPLRPGQVAWIGGLGAMGTLATTGMVLMVAGRMAARGGATERAATISP